MAFSPVAKGHQYRLGFRLGASDALIVFWPVVEHKRVVPDEAVSGFSSGESTIAVYASDGTTAKLAETAMTGSEPARYVLDLSNTTTYPVGTYQIEHRFAYSGVETTTSAVTFTSGRRLFGIYPSVPDPLVTDGDLTEDIYDLNDYLGDRQDWSSVVAESWADLLSRLSREKRPDGEFLDPYTIADSTELYKPHKLLSLLAVVREAASTERSDRWGVLYERYKQDFDDEYAALVSHQMTLWASGPETSAEQRETNNIRSHRKGLSWDDAGTQKNKSIAPRFRMDTEW